MPKMTEGKAYTNTLRVCLLADDALHWLLMLTTPGYQKRGDATYDEDRDDLLKELMDDDTRELHEPYATHTSLFSTLQKEYNDL